jgi:hypothetical protein
MKQKLFILLFLIATLAHTQTRQPFSSIGKKVKVVTLTNGKYDEFFDENTLQRVGSSVININTKKITKINLTQEEIDELENAQASRFLSVDPLTSQFSMLTPYQYASNTPIQAIDLDGLEAVYYKKFWGMSLDKPKLKQGEWYEIINLMFTEHYSIDEASFKVAAIFNSENNRSEVYKSIRERHDFYNTAQEILDDKKVDSKWFKAAAIVTNWDAVGGVEYDMFNIIGKSAGNFLSEGNKYLFSKNMDNFKKLSEMGQIYTTFTTAKKNDGTSETLNLNDYFGRNLDYALVKFEQTQVQNFIDFFSAKNPKADMNSIFSTINKAFGNKLGNSDIANVIQTQFTDKGKKFDFKNYEDRVTLGNGIVDILRAKK